MGMSKKLRVLFIAAECAPFAKTGGLADVVGALPKALAGLGHETRLVMPFYKSMRDSGWGKTLVKSSVHFPAWVPETRVLREFDIREDKLPGSEIPVWMLDQPLYYERERFYGDEKGDYADNLDRFAFFAHAALQACIATGWIPDVIHAHDWHAGLVPVYLRTLYSKSPLAKASVVYTVHNLAYQGLFPDHQFVHLGLPGELFIAEQLEFYGQVNFMKAALLFADRVNTVSPRYADEIRGQEFGCGLDGVLRKRGETLSGIINGLDYSEWSPEHDKHLPAHYSVQALDRKKQVKAELLKLCGFEGDDDLPLLAVISRLDNMKGLNLIEEIMDYLMHMDLRLVLLGTGDPRFHESFQRVAEMYPDRCSVHLKFDNAVAHLIEGGSDIFLMPSRFEPCGLNQLISLRYGTVPVVRAVGGLADTVKEYDPKTGLGNGFTFHEFSSMGLFNAIQRALEAYKDSQLWAKIQKTGMSADYSWAASARAYVTLYEKSLSDLPIA